MAKAKIEKYQIYAARVSDRHPWRWWARPPWGAPVQFPSWTRAAAFLALHRELHKGEGRRP